MKILSNRQLRADIMLLLITVIWGSSFTLMKNVLESLPSFAFLALRFSVATIVLLAIFFKRLKGISLKTTLFGCIIGLMLFGGMALQVTGLYYTTASNSAFITGLNVVMVPVISVLFLRKKPDINSVIGVTMAFIGLFFLTGGINVNLSLRDLSSFSDILGALARIINTFNFGDLLTLLCAVCFALQIIFIDRFTKDSDAVQLSIIQIGFAALLYNIVWLGFDNKPMVFNGSVILTLIITGVLGTAAAFALQTVAQKDTSPTHTALILTAEPVFGAFFAMIIPNSLGQVEVIQLHTAIGCSLILLGMLVCEVRIGKKRLNV